MKKIALCFLTIGNLSQPKLWSKIFENNKDKLNIYIHNKIDFIDEEYNIHNFCIKDRVETEWGKKSLVEATLKLFKTAFLDDDNYFFLLLSDSCIPLYNFNYIYEKINIMNSNIIYGSILGKKQDNKNLYDGNFFHKKNINRFIKTSQSSFFHNKYFKQSQWFLLKRDTVNFFLKNDFLFIFTNNFFAADEHYFINICEKYKINYLNKLVTFVNWNNKNDCYKKPVTYHLLHNDNIKDIKKTNAFFMRKVSKNCKLPSYFDDIS